MGVTVAQLAKISVGTSGQREFVGAMLLIMGLLFYVGGAGYVSWLLLPLPEAWSEWIGKVLIAVGVVLVVSSVGVIFS